MSLSHLDLHNIWLITLLWPIYLFALIIAIIYDWSYYTNSDKTKKDCGCGN